MIEALKEIFEESATKIPEKNFGKIVIMDYATGGIYVYDYDGSDVLEFLDTHGHNDNECYYMLVNDFNIYIG